MYPYLKENRDLFFIGLQGPDPIYYHHLRKKDTKAYIASKMHTEKTGDFLVSALCHLKKYDINSKEFGQCFSYLCGFICHYILDSKCHPFINSWEAETGVSHMEIEEEFEFETEE